MSNKANLTINKTKLNTLLILTAIKNYLSLNIQRINNFNKKEYA